MIDTLLTIFIIALAISMTAVLVALIGWLLALSRNPFKP